MTFFGNLVVPGRHLRPEEILTLAENQEKAEDRPRLSRHLDRCPECRGIVAALGETFGALSPEVSTGSEDLAPLGHFLREDIEDADRQAGLVDWDDFQSSVREELLARSVRRDSVVRRWTGIALSPRHATAWTFGVVVALFALSAAAVGGFWHFSVEHAPLSEEPARVVGAASPATDSWFMIEEEDALDVEAMAWSETADIFSAIDDLDAGEEEALREFILEAANAPVADPIAAPQTPTVLSEGSPYMSHYLLR
jgi:hypothetical protein